MVQKLARLLEGRVDEVAAQARISRAMGLGLGLARSIVTADTGVTEARNVSPHGAQSEVRLPLAGTSQNAAAGPPHYGGTM